MCELVKVINCKKVVKFHEIGILFGISYYYVGCSSKGILLTNTCELWISETHSYSFCQFLKSNGMVVKMNHEFDVKNMKKLLFIKKSGDKRSLTN